MLGAGLDWADEIEAAVEEDMAAKRRALGARGAAVAEALQNEYDMLADNSRDGINLLFKQVGSGFPPFALHDISFTFLDFPQTMNVGRTAAGLINEVAAAFGMGGAEVR